VFVWKALKCVVMPDVTVIAVEGINLEYQAEMLIIGQWTSI
jgi:hypothetical protein